RVQNAPTAQPEPATRPAAPAPSGAYRAKADEAPPSVPPADGAAPSPASPPPLPPPPPRRVPRGLPDVEQLAATLQTQPPPPEAAPQPLATATGPATSGYRRGLLRGLVLAGALLVAYLGGQVWVASGQAPESVAAFLARIDGLRAGLQGALTGLFGGGR
ncbi:MAG: hypothetical protein Q4G26_14500, partial [Paracoccus sp. (in: a-proteobacteria)]|nr:hypothetical protein [Paracoccus sp. (in: a-proteobacteria)]